MQYFTRCKRDLSSFWKKKIWQQLVLLQWSRSMLRRCHIFWTGEVNPDSGKGSLYNNRISTPAKEVEKIPVQKNLFEEEEKRFPIEEKNTKAEEILRPAVSVASIPTAKGKKVKRIILFFEDGSFEDYEKWGYLHIAFRQPHFWFEVFISVR